MSIPEQGVREEGRRDSEENAARYGKREPGERRNDEKRGQRIEEDVVPRVLRPNCDDLIGILASEQRSGGAPDEEVVAARSRSRQKGVR